MRIVLLIIIAAAMGLVGGYSTARVMNRDPGDQFRVLLGSSSVVPQKPLPNRDAKRRVVVENGEEFHFGVMEHDETRSHKFLIRNNTQSPLTLEIVDKTCKCTIGRLPDDAIRPGEVGEVNMEWTAKRYETEFRQSATIATSDLVQSRITLAVVGHVMQVVSATPPSLAFTDIPAGTSSEQTIVLRAFQDEDFVVERATWLNDSTADFFEVSFEPAPTELSESSDPRIPAPKVTTVCRVNLAGGMPLGMFDQRLILHTTSERMARMEIPVMGNVVSDVQIVGRGFNNRDRVLNLGVVESKTGLQRKLRILVKGPHRQSFEIQEIVTDPAEYLQVTAADPQSFNQGAVVHVPLEVSIPAGAAPVNRMGDQGHAAAKIVMRTSHPVDPEITIDTRFAVTDRDGVRQ